MQELGAAVRIIRALLIGVYIRGSGIFGSFVAFKLAEKCRIGVHDARLQARVGPAFGCLHELGALFFVGVLFTRALLGGVHVRTLDFWKLRYCQACMLSVSLPSHNGYHRGLLYVCRGPGIKRPLPQGGLPEFIGSQSGGPQKQILQVGPYKPPYTPEQIFIALQGFLKSPWF